MWQKITATRIQKETDELLNAGFVDNFYVVLTQDKQQPLKHRLTVANDGTITTVTINAIKNNTGYLVFNIKELEKIPVKCLRKMNKNGLFMSIRKRKDYKPYTSIHRLVCCIDGNCKGLEIHHINKKVDDNRWGNLVKVTQSENKQLEELYWEDERMMLHKGYELKNIQAEQKQQKKKYLARNEQLELEIIKYSINHSTKETVNKFKKYIKTQQRIRDIINFYYYKEDFIEWLKEINKGKNIIETSEEIKLVLG